MNMERQYIPEIMTAKEVAGFLRIGLNKAYDLMHSPSFPSVKIGPRRIIVSKDALITWLNCQVTTNHIEQQAVI